MPAGLAPPPPPAHSLRIGKVASELWCSWCGASPPPPAPASRQRLRCEGGLQATDAGSQARKSRRFPVSGQAIGSAPARRGTGLTRLLLPLKGRRM